MDINYYKINIYIANVFKMNRLLYRHIFSAEFCKIKFYLYFFDEEQARSSGSI